MKPTYGRVSRYGLVAYASSLDQIGPLAQDVTDAAILLTAVAGYDPLDSTSVNIAVPDYARRLPDGRRPSGTAPLDGRPCRCTGRSISSPACRQRWRTRCVRAIRTLADAGRRGPRNQPAAHRPGAPRLLPDRPAEASANLARYDGIRYGLSVAGGSLWETYRKHAWQGFGPEVKRRIMLGTYALSAGYYDAYYLKAQQVRTLIKSDFDAALTQVDIIACPTARRPRSA